MKVRKSMFTLFVWVFLGCWSCSNNDHEEISVKHIFLIGFDGWSGHSVENASMPTLKKLMSEGAYTLKNRAVIPTSSAPNWASMFMGVGPEIHGYLQWGSKVPEFDPLELNHYGMFPGIFGVVRDSKPDSEIGYLYGWDGMNFLVDTLAINYRIHVPHSIKNLTDSAVQYILDQKPDFCGVIYDEPDEPGHLYGWESSEYYNRLSELDVCIGRLMEAIEKAGILSESVIIVTSDHGGVERKHGGNTLNEFESPLIFWGAGIKEGEIPVSTMKYDIAPTIAYLFDIESPLVWVGRPIASIL